ncbi:MAG: hypothetical protein ACRDSH_13000, partial [Pseudonocardiaceae bacterium]
MNHVSREREGRGEPGPVPPVISAGAAAQALQEYFLANADSGDNAANYELVAALVRRLRTGQAWRGFPADGRDDCSRSPGRPVTQGTNELPAPPASGHRRVVVHASCSVHRGPVGFTNLVVSQREGEIELNPHVDGSCTLTLSENEACALRDALT